MKYTAGIDLGGTNIAVGIVDSAYRIIARATRKTAMPRPAEEIFNDVAEATASAIASARISTKDLAWAGIGIPGISNQQTGYVDYACNLDFYNQETQKNLSEKLGLPVYIDNDANAAAYGEFVAGGAKGVNDAVVITLGTGIGGGIIIDRKVYTGFNFAGAEIGHTVIQKDGRPCTCGRKGCFEQYAAATGLMITTKEMMTKHPKSRMWELCKGNLESASGRTAFDAMRLGDEAAKETVGIFIGDLACGVVNIINTFAPEILCISGGISKEGDTLIKPLTALVEKEVYSRFSSKQTFIKTAELGNDAGIIGAAALGKQFL